MLGAAAETVGKVGPGCGMASAAVAGAGSAATAETAVLKAGTRRPLRILATQQ